MTSSQTWSTFVLSYTSMTSLFIQITSTNTGLTSVKSSRLYSFAIRVNDGPCHSPNYPRLARTVQDQGNSIIPWIHQFLPSVHTCLLGYHYSSYPAHPQRHQVGFLRKVSKSVQCPQDGFSLGSVTDPLDPGHTNHHQNGCLGLCNCSDSIHHSLGWRNPPSCFPFTHPNLPRIKL